MELTLEAVRLGMNMANMRAEVASANIANVDVAGYRMQRVDFAQAIGLLRQTADATRPWQAGRSEDHSGRIFSTR